jgi:NADP-dependent 3-hydroxy acid dehydrogenase YdfG
MTRPLADQIVVITGASSGIGRAIARAFAAKGARLALLARNQPALEAAAEEARRAGTEALVLPLDIADEPAVEAAAAAVEARFGRIDTWVNNAMATVLSPAQQMTPDEFRRVTEVNYLGTVWGTLAALRRMVPRDEGIVIQIGSALAYRSIPLQSAYCATKFAVRGFTDSLRSELIHDGSRVRLSMLQLPAVNTPQFEVARSRLPKHPQPVPPIFTPELIADATLYAAERAPREMIIGGPALQAVVGQKVIPGLLDRYLASKAYSGQQADLPYDPNRPDNLFATVPGDHGAHGPFTDRANGRSLQLWLRMRPALAAGLAGAALAAGAGTLAAMAAAQIQDSKYKLGRSRRRPRPRLGL